MENKIQHLHELIKEAFPTPTLIQINVTSEGITIDVEYRANLDGFSMKNTSGAWVGTAR